MLSIDVQWSELGDALTDDFEKRWTVEMQNIRSRISPWERSKMPPHPEVINEETITEYIKTTKPLVERGTFWVSISPLAIPIFELVKIAVQILYYFYIGFWVPFVLFIGYSLIFAPDPDMEPMSTASVCTVVGFLLLMGSPTYLIHRRIKNIKL